MSIVEALLFVVAFPVHSFFLECFHFPFHFIFDVIFKIKVKVIFKSYLFFGGRGGGNTF